MNRQFASFHPVVCPDSPRRVVDHTARQIIHRLSGTICLRKVTAQIEMERRQDLLGYRHFIDARMATMRLSVDDLHRVHWLLSILSITDEIGPVTLVVSDESTFRSLTHFAQWTVHSPKIEVWLKPAMEPAPDRTAARPCFLSSAGEPGGNLPAGLDFA